MTPPSTILYSQIRFEHPDYGPRRRKEYSNLPDLATSIESQGLEVPLILAPLSDDSFLLVDGGRRSRALELRYEGQDFTLHHAVTGDPSRPGFILKGETLSRRAFWLTELTANLHREALAWNEEMDLIVDAWKEWEREEGLKGKRAVSHTLGAMLGVGHADMNAAINLHAYYHLHPEQFVECSSMHNAYKKLLEIRRRELEEELAERLRAKVIAPPAVPAAPQPRQEDKKEEAAVEDSVSIDFSRRFWQGDSLVAMKSLATVGGALFDHIFCDPDYAVPEDLLSSGLGTVASRVSSGVAQDSVDESLSHLRHFFPLAFSCLKPSGYLVLWMDQDHWEKLRDWASDAGFSVQRWMFIWHKTDHLSNASPSTNFPKDYETALICHRPGATLAKQAPRSSVFSYPKGQTTTAFGHPFAKPPAVWRKVMESIASPGQHVYDPFLGSASSAVAALDLGLIPWGSELNPQHFNSATINLHNKYREIHKGRKVVFE